MIPHIHYLQHVPFEGLGVIGDWAAMHNAPLTATRFFESADLPALDAFDWLIIMGGPMSVNEYDLYPWLIEEKRLITAAVHGGKTVIGVCLGAQLIAAALGAKVYPNRFKEIGWFPVTWTDEVPALHGLPMTPRTLDVFHWHGETFDLPPGAVHLARSKACEHQAFAVGDRVFAFQFHLEMTPAAIEAMLSHCGDECVPAAFIQLPAAMIAGAAQCAQVNRLMSDLLTGMIKKA